MTHADRLRKHPHHESIPGYWHRHLVALENPMRLDTVDGALAGMLRAWANYADAHRAAYESGIGDDGVLGPEWAAIGRAFLGLLNGHLGALDGGALDAAIRGSLEAETFSSDE